ncbi:Putative NADPH-quinone reductase (modulator of drug activity B) [Paenibacillus sophorae]|uniref:NAD(P)H-dependent oxidoreductase n=1 Tax=Paenibacillus sophorae TaxID=1333845 RepID=A0A1H8VCB9_9BACL|nr:NAD(P)H-dependent oxidoreductase [Paenibacillus sophorae]QWU16693.1 NAD(P)H-dependent oxidoreductase [Paenibacillus sophorae]SEP13066.1 Putative NADPH-quinone reductase (modulator of drug activity B) [Paenibacillus sophorae]
MSNHSTPSGSTATLVIVAHPDLETSRINKRLTAELERRGNVTIHRLYEAYPDEKIDVAREQALLTTHDRIVFQFPLFWYSSPSLLKKWMDEVFELGFAHGRGGDKLNGKELLIATSSGGAENMYQAGGLHNYSYSELLRPFQQTANLAGMIYLSPFVVGGIREVTDEQLEKYAADYADYVEGQLALSRTRG